MVSKYGGDDVLITPTQIRWSPFDLPKDDEKVNFIQGLKSLAGAGDPACRSGLAVHIYTANTDMGKTAFYNSDGDFLIGKLFGKEKEKKRKKSKPCYDSSSARHIGYLYGIWKNQGFTK